MNMIMRNFFLLLLISAGMIFESGCSTLPIKQVEKDTVYATMGDSIAYGALAYPPETNSFPALVADYLNRVYPKTTLVNCAYPGYTSSDYLNVLPTMLAKITASKAGPLARATLFIGLADIVIIDVKMTEKEAVAESFRYKSTVQKIIDAVLKYSPSCKLVLCTLADQSNGGQGPRVPYKPSNALKEYNDRIRELGDSNKLPVADIYGHLLGHLEYFIKGDGHPNNAGHAEMASVIEPIFRP